MDIGLLRQRGVELDAKNFFHTDDGGNENGARYRSVGGNDGMRSKPKLDPTSPTNAFGGRFRQSAAPR